jgi:hypothetical protein
VATAASTGGSSSTTGGSMTGNSGSSGASGGSGGGPMDPLSLLVCALVTGFAVYRRGTANRRM